MMGIIISRMIAAMPCSIRCRHGCLFKYRAHMRQMMMIWSGSAVPTLPSHIIAPLSEPSHTLDRPSSRHKVNSVWAAKIRPSIASCMHTTMNHLKTSSLSRHRAARIMGDTVLHRLRYATSSYRLPQSSRQIHNQPPPLSSGSNQPISHSLSI